MRIAALALIAAMLAACAPAAPARSSASTPATSPAAASASVEIAESPEPSLSAAPASSTPGATATSSTPSAAALSPVPTRTAAATARPAPTPSSTAAYIAYFNTLPPGATLPNDAQCASEIARSSWEPRLDNRIANQTNVYTQGFRLQSSYFADFGPSFGARVTGNFTGTTDEILRWAACKWGFDENTVRAQAVIESYWHQSTLGDCGEQTQPQTNGCSSVGILQVRGADIPPTQPGTWPAAWTSTAFNADYTLAIRRLCYEGKETWLRDFNSTYAAGDLWGCIGRWFSGRWHDAAADGYIQRVRDTMNARTWTTF
jgi:hypothetical protein